MFNKENISELNEEDYTRPIKIQLEEIYRGSGQKLKHLIDVSWDNGIGFLALFRF